MTRFDLLSVTVRWLCGCWLLWRVAPVGRSRADGAADLPVVGRPPCSIVIPARDEARTLFESLLRAGNAHGLYSEDLDFSTRRQLGNFPQAYSHLALIDCALELSRDEDNTLIQL